MNQISGLNILECIAAILLLAVVLFKIRKRPESERAVPSPPKPEKPANNTKEKHILPNPAYYKRKADGVFTQPEPTPFFLTKDQINNGDWDGWEFYKGEPGLQTGDHGWDLDDSHIPGNGETR